MTTTTASTLPSFSTAALPNSVARTPSPTESRPGAYASESLKFARGCSQKASGAKLRFGLEEVAKSDVEFAIAKEAASEPWMINTTQEQLGKLRTLQL
jgi:hypothetical protein